MNMNSALELVEEMSKHLKGKGGQESGAALGMLVGSLVAEFSINEEDIPSGVAVISKYAEGVAVELFRDKKKIAN